MRRNQRRQRPRKRPQQRRQGPEPVREPEPRRREPAREPRLLPSCRRRPGQQQRSRKPTEATCSFLIPREVSTKKFSTSGVAMQVGTLLGLLSSNPRIRRVRSEYFPISQKL